MDGGKSILVVFALALATELASGCIGDTDPSPESKLLPGPEASEDSCEAYAAQGCVAGNVHWIDGCGQVSELVEECTGERACQSVEAVALCCYGHMSSGPVAANAQAFRQTWTFPNRGRDLVLELNVLEDPVAEMVHRLGIRLLFAGDVEVQMNVHARRVPGAGLKGVYIWRSGTTSTDYARGPAQSGYMLDEPGDPYPQVGIHRDYDWGLGALYVRLHRAEPSTTPPGDWLDVYVSSDGTSETYVGGVVIPRRFADRPETIPEQALFFHYLHNVADYSVLPATSYLANVTLDTTPATNVSFAYTGFENVDVRWDPMSQSAYSELGADVYRCSPEGSLYP